MVMVVDKWAPREVSFLREWVPASACSAAKEEFSFGCPSES